MQSEVREQKSEAPLLRKKRALECSDPPQDRFRRGELGVALLIRGIRAIRGFPVVVSKIDETHPKCH
jgi:hypothetical protein